MPLAHAGVEIVCSSSKRAMHDACDASKTSVYRLLGNNVTLDQTTVTSWPQTTEVWCWHCCHSFDDVPMCVPRCKRGAVYEVFGVFCSLNCAIAFIMQQCTYDHQQQLLMLRDIATRVFKLPAQQTMTAGPAPDKAFLKVFGGHLDIHTFRQCSVRAACVLLTPPFVSLPMVLQTNEAQMRHQITRLRRPLVSVKAPPRATGACLGLKEGGLYATYLEQQRNVDTNNSTPPKGSVKLGYLKTARQLADGACANNVNKGASRLFTLAGLQERPCEQEPKIADNFRKRAGGQKTGKATTQPPGKRLFDFLTPRDKGEEETKSKESSYSQ